MAQNKKRLTLLGLILIVAVAAVWVWSNRAPSTGDVRAENSTAVGDGSSSKAAMADAEQSSEKEAAAESALVTPKYEIGIEALDTPNPLGEIRIGSPDAPVTIVEYASLTCPHCGAFHNETLPELTKKYVDAGHVQILFRPFPFDGLATAGSMLVQCVASAQRYPFLNLLFSRQNSWLRSPAPLEDMQALARQAGLSEADVLVCLKDESVLAGIRTMQKAAHEQLEVNSTPTFFINGERVEGNQSVSTFSQVIDPLLPTPTE